MARRNSVEVAITANDEASRIISQAMKSVDGSFKDVEKAVRQTTRDFGSLNSSLKKLGFDSKEIDKLNQEIKETKPDILERELQNVRNQLKRLGLDASYIEKVEKELKDAGKEGSKAGKDMQEGFNQAEKSSQSLADRLFSVKNIVIGIATAASAKSAWNWMVGANANMEQYQNTLATVMKSEKEAVATLEWATKFAAKTPFEIPGIVEATVKLEAYGLKAQEMLPGIGDMAAVMGKDLIQAVEAVADAQTGELERLKEFGITKNMIIQQATEMGMQGIVNAKGQITDMANFNVALMALMEERFKGGMERQATTFKGMMSNLSDSVGTFGRNIGEPLFEEAKKGLGRILGWIEQAQSDGTIERYGQKIKDAMITAVEWMKTGWTWANNIYRVFKDNWSYIEPVLTGIVAGFTALKIITVVQGWVIGLTTAWNLYRNSAFVATAAQRGLNAALRANPIGLVVTAIGVLVTAGAALYQNWDTVSKTFLKIWRAMASGVGSAVDWILGKVSDLVSFIPGLSDKIDSFRAKAQAGFEEYERKLTASINSIRTNHKYSTASMTDDLNELREEKLSVMKSSLEADQAMVKSNASLGNSNMSLGSSHDKTAASARGAAKAHLEAKDAVEEYKKAQMATVEFQMQQLDKSYQLRKAQLDEEKDKQKLLTLELEHYQQKQKLVAEELNILQEKFDLSKKVKGEDAEATRQLKLAIMDLQLEQINLANSVKETTETIRKQQVVITPSTDGSYSRYNERSGIGVARNKDGEYSVVDKTGNITRIDNESRQEEIREISQRNNVDLGVAESMWETNLSEGNQIYHRGGRITKRGPKDVPMIGKEGEYVVPEGAGLIDYDRLSRIFVQALQNISGGSPITVNVYDNNFRDGRDAGNKIYDALRRLGV
jgi:hypothetical protein